MAIIYLVSCTKRKKASPAPARDLYSPSARFRHASSIAERKSDSWYILSAKNHLVEPDQCLEPYELSLNTMRLAERKKWSSIVFAQLEQKVRPGDTVVILAGKSYYKFIRPGLEKVCRVEIPMEHLGMGKQMKWLKEHADDDLSGDLKRFYDLLNLLESGLGGRRLMFECTGRMIWPERGVYFFFEPEEFLGDSTALRVVRVGTHALKRGSKSTLWGRMRAHRGVQGGGGNHRGSVFRLHVGSAIKASESSRVDAPNWGMGSSASKDVRAAEQPLEEQVSEYIGMMNMLWLTVEDEAGPQSDRAFLEKNAIALLSREGPIADPPSPRWLGRQSPNQMIRESGLWNVNFVGDSYDRRFLEVLERYVSQTIREHGKKYSQD